MTPHEGAAELVNQAMVVCFRGGFRRVLLRGDTKFSQTEHLDRWDEQGDVTFLFGLDASPNLKIQAELLRTSSTVIRDAFKAGKLKVEAGVYDLATGKVTLI